MNSTVHFLENGERYLPVIDVLLFDFRNDVYVF